MRVDEEVIHGAQQHPVKAVLRADDAADIAEAAGIIPQADVNGVQHEFTDCKFQCRNRRSHQQKEQDFPRDRVADGKPVLGLGEQIEDAERPAVQGQTRAGEKAGIDPVLLRDISAVKDFQHPAGESADGEKKGEDECDVHGSGSFPETAWELRIASVYQNLPDLSTPPAGSAGIH